MPAPGDGVQHRDRVIFHVLQDRHLPMTAMLASSLAEFEGAAAPGGDPFWGAGYLLAGGAIGLRGKIGNTPAWSRLFAVYVQVIVEPILRDVALRIGSVTLTTLGARPRRDQTTDFDLASRKIETAVCAALKDPTIMGQAFWIAAGVTLLGRFRKTPAGQPRQTAGRPPEFPFLADLNFAHLVYGMEPVLEEDRIWTKNQLRASARSKRLRVGIRPREGGVTGVQHSRRDSDVADALMSAFVLPKEIRLIKLLEEGFLIPRRPPYRRPDRDLLSMTFQTPEVATLGAADLVKAAWVDATIRLRILFANMSMAKSEIGFGHMCAAGTIASAVTAQVDQPKGRFDILALGGEMRANMISMSSLVPNIFETAAPHGQTRQESGPSNPRVHAQLQVRAACAMQAISATAKPLAGRPVRPQLGDYAQVCLIEVAPRVVRGDETVVSDWRTNRNQIVRSYELDKAQECYLARILCPPVVKVGATFVLCSDARTAERELEIKDQGGATETIAHTIGALSSWIITQNILAASHG